MKSLSVPGASSQIILPPNVHQQFWQADCTVLFYTPRPCCSRKTEHTYITRSLYTPHNPFFPFFLGGRRAGVTSHLHPSLFLLSHFLIGLIPCSLACPIIFWNIQGNVSSCCHSNYYNIQHGSWLSSFWKCFSFLSRSSVTCEACRFFFSRASVPSWPRRETTRQRGGGVGAWSKLERST